MSRTAVASYYDLLEVHPSSTADEIKRAYYKQIRIFTSEKYPEQFKELRRAYETLSDPVKKREYDVALFSDPESKKNRQQIEHLIQNENYEQALRLIKQEILNNGVTQDLLKDRIICELKLGKYQEVLKQLNSLDISLKEDEEFFYYLGSIAYRETSRYHDAEEAGRKLLLVNPENTDYQYSYAKTLYYQNKYGDIKHFYNDVIQTKSLNIEHVELLLDYITLQDKVGVSEIEKRKLIYAILSLPQNNENRESILAQMIDYINAQEWIAFSHAREICDLAEQMNTQNIRYISDAIRNIRNDISRQEGSTNRQQRTEQQHTTYDEPVYEPVYEQQNPGGYQANTTVKKKGNILFAIILGLILTGPLTIVGGIIGGIIYYYHAEKIWNLLGCLIAIVIVIALIGLFFG